MILEPNSRPKSIRRLAARQGRRLENVRRAGEDIAKAAKFAVEVRRRTARRSRTSLEAALATETPSVESLKSGSELTLACFGARL